MDLRYPRHARVRARADFDRIFRDGKRVAHPALALHWLADGQPARLGLAVSRKVDPRAVGRNRIKRILRDTFRLQRPSIAAGAYVLVARPPASACAAQALRETMIALLRRAGALPAIAPAGTMPPATSTRAAPPSSPSAPIPTGE